MHFSNATSSIYTPSNAHTRNLTIVIFRSKNCTFPTQLKALSCKSSNILKVYITHFSIYKGKTTSHLLGCNDMLRNVKHINK